MGLVWIGVLILVGIAPLIAGFIKKNIKLGIIGFASCIVAGLIAGLLLGLPVAVIFTLIIVLKKTDGGNFTQPPPNPPANFDA